MMCPTFYLILSSGYLDVSVHRVPFLTLWIGVRMTGVSPARFPHSEICGYNRYLLFPAAYRSLSRLSSALSAKASTLRSFLLDLFRFYSVRNLVCNKSHFLFGLQTFYGYSRMSWLRLNLIQNLFCMKFSMYNVCQDNFLTNGDGEIRTLDPLLARQVLSQLSYTPI